MRKSSYTVVAEGASGEHLLYNTARGTFSVLDDDAYADFEACGGRHAEVLVEQGFLTELSSEEELAAQRELFEAQRRDHSELTLVLAPTYACNLRCPYCYEQGHNAIKGKMGPDVVRALVAFVAERYNENPFAKLSIQWYGGDPSLALDVVEDVSQRLIGFCNEHDVSYDAMMLTNCNAIDGRAVDMLVRAKVSHVLVTIDGFEETHNARRVSAAGLNSFERNIEAAKLFMKHGIDVHANMNVDRVNWPEFHPLRDYLRNETGIELTCGRLCDYGHFFGTRDFKRPAFDLFEHEEFCRIAHEAFVESEPGPGDVQRALSPSPRFCNGQRDDYFIIDTLGDIYLCDGYIGEQDRVVGNIVAGNMQNAFGRVSHDPYEDAQCSACEFLPLCQGNCDWERRASDMACHPLRTMIGDYLRDWQKALAAER